MTIPQMPVHNHAASTTGPHFHSITDPTHLHGLGFQPVQDGGVNYTINDLGGGGAISTRSISTSLPSNTTSNAFIGINSDNYTDIGINVANQGNSNPMNVMNPMAYINIMIKL
jgi:hypothetical protein